MNLNELGKDIHNWAKGNGFYDQNRSFGDSLMLIVSEAAEALESYRDGMPYDEVHYDIDTLKPEGIPVELADILIRVLDLMNFLGIDIDSVVAEKMEYNKTRPYKNGRKIL